MFLGKALMTIKDACQKKEPEIYVIAGLIGMGVSIGCAVAGTIKAVKAIDELKIKKASETNTEVEKIELSKKEVAKIIVKNYIPTLATAGLSTYFILRSNRIYANRLVTVAAAYKLSEKNLIEYKDKVKEVLGPKDEKKINDALAQARTAENPPDENAIIYTGNGETLCREELTGRYFRSSKQAIESAINNLNRTALTCMYTSVNELFYELGLEKCSLGDNLGWDIDNGLIEPIFSTAITDNGTPILVLDFRNLPKAECYNRR